MKSENRFCFIEIFLSDGFHLRNPNLDLMDLQIFCLFWKSEKGFAKIRWFCEQRFIIFQFCARNRMGNLSKLQRQSTFAQQLKVKRATK